MWRSKIFLATICICFVTLTAHAQKNLTIDELRYSIKPATNYDSFFHAKGYMMKQSVSDDSMKVYHYYLPNGEGPMNVIIAMITATGARTVEFQTLNKTYYTKIRTAVLTSANGWKLGEAETIQLSDKKVKMYHYSHTGSEIIIYSSSQGSQTWYCIQCLVN